MLRDSARLENVASVELKVWKIIAAAICFLIVSAFLGIFLVILTPLHDFLPGYMKRATRLTAEETLLRIDSLRRVNDRNEEYISNFLEVLSTDRTPSDSLYVESRTISLQSDSLLPTSKEERKFVKMMQEREKYNISVLAPMAADGMMFFPVCEDGVVASETRNSRTARVILPKGAPACAIADGNIVAVYRNSAADRFAVIIQHPRGFVSRYSGLSTPYVDQGEMISGGQAIGQAASKSGVNSGVDIEMWHNGNPLIPYRYLDSLATEDDGAY